MIESPLLVEMRAKASQDLILEALKARFGAIPLEVTRLLREVLKEKRLLKLNAIAATCPDLTAFKEALLK